MPPRSTIVRFTVTFGGILLLANYLFGPTLLREPNPYLIPHYRDDARFENGHFLSHSNWTVPALSELDYIEQLFLKSYNDYRSYLKRQSKTYSQAVSNYKKRYKRNPPAGFEKWYNHAKWRGCLVIDDYDVIEESIAPFRSLTPAAIKLRIKELRKHDKKHRIGEILIRGGTVANITEGLWQMIGWDGFVGNLPDMDILFNAWDEPFVLPLDNGTYQPVQFSNAAKKPLWPKVEEQCMSEGKDMGTVDTNGYLENMAQVKGALDLCDHPEYENTHGFFNAPSSLTVTRQLVPIFSIQTVSIFKDLLLPTSATFHPNFLDNDDVRPFPGKIRKMYWRGSPTGGDLTEKNVLNGHRVRLALLSQEYNDLVDAKLTTYFGNKKALKILNDTFGKPQKADKKLENDYAYLMDMDGNGQSGRFYRLLRSQAVVFKLTAFKQWHDDRLFPWVHYVPVKLGMPDMVDILKWMSGTERGWELSRRIAEEADWWARRALRLEDAEVYIYRMLLEYAELLREQ
ncbi:F-actin-capping protein subunit beta [Orbilia ellipsospora]|uniref:F-actin-capping protein subunit beta n=1 Tax=Orbilia ellipsospora TaxID=2528407 RepID=A0AAV9WWV2_9PEZI